MGHPWSNLYKSSLGLYHAVSPVLPILAIRPEIYENHSFENHDSGKAVAAGLEPPNSGFFDLGFLQVDFEGQFTHLSNGGMRAGIAGPIAEQEQAEVFAEQSQGTAQPARTMGAFCRDRSARI